MLPRPQKPLDFFGKVNYADAVEMQPGWTWAEGSVYQGRFAHRYVDSLADKNIVSAFPVRQKANAWADFQYLCLSAKLADPKSGSLKITCVTRWSSRDGFTLNCGSWAGWKQHRLDFRKYGARTSRDLGITWENVTALEFSIEGGISDLYLDDVHLCN
ncbi:MAG: hypothetical protein L0Z55_02665 [Planctomycetes bacterium]|nr:hypothetical protein [Planctomycetota bacterium]